jgi:hypothetical membrane protein
MKYTNKMVTGILMFTGALLFLFALIISEALYPGYHTTQVISDLGVGQTAILFNPAIFIFGLCSIVCAYLLLNVQVDRIFIVLLGITGIGAVLVGLIPETAGVPHVIAAAMVFVSGSLCAISGYRVFRGPFAVISLILGIITIIATVLLAGGLYLGLGIGGMERIAAYPVITWTLGAGGFLMSPGK